MKRTPIILFLFALNTLNSAAKQETTGLQALIAASRKDTNQQSNEWETLEYLLKK